MFKHLLIPLDGSPMSEPAVTVAACLAKRDGSSVMLLHVLEESAQPTVHGQPHLTDYKAADEYLQRIAKERFGKGIKVDYHVHRHPVKAIAKDLARHAEILRPDLIILCAHGDVRLRDRFFGNIAQQIIDSQDAPVLMLQSRNHPAACPFSKILVLLDGKTEHESALAPAVALAQTCSADVILMTVVETDDTLRPESISTGMLPNTAMELLELKESDAKAYLQSHILKLKEKGLSVSGCMDRGNPIHRIMDYVQERKVDLIVLATHGKAGTQAFWAGTLPPKLIRKLPDVSFLLVPATLSK
jgi:nucleotide-binding universal stress UspA family protein